MGKRKFTGKNKEAKKSKTDDNEGKDGLDGSPPETEKNYTNKPTKGNTFIIKHFRKELAAKQGQTVALTQFLQVCLNPDNEVDYMLEYLKAGGNSHEILRQINPDSKKNLTLATPTFHLFHLIIMKVQSDQPHMIAITEEACRYFLNNFNSTVEIMISENSGPRHRKIILKLLTSMVTLNPDLGIEVLNQAYLTPKNLQYILEKPNYKEKDNVRTSFVHFMTSFLIEGHMPLIKALLEKPGLLALVIPGLVQDEPEAILIFLNILKKNIVENIHISKTLKLKTFSHNVLHQLFKIYFWKGPPETSQTVVNEHRPEILNLLSEIMLTLFTSNKLGLYFVDNTLGTSDAHRNQNLYNALLTLKRPWENKYQCEIILEIVYQCPDLHRAIINLVEQNFEPQHSPIWEKTCEFVIKLLTKMKPEEMVQRFSNMNSSQVANFVRFTTIPVPLLKHVQSSLLKNDQTVSLHCIKMLVLMLSTLKRYMHILQMSNTQTNIVDLKNKLEYFLPKHLPAPAVIISLVDQIIKHSQNKEDAAPKEYNLPKIDDVDSLIFLMDLLLLYNEIHPAHFETLEGSLNIKDILDYSITLKEGHVSILKFKIVSLWLTLDSSAVSLKNPIFKDMFQIMLEVYTSDDDDTWIEAKVTIFKFFKTTEIFEADEDEIHIILYTLRNCNVNTSIISDVVEYVLHNNKDLTEYVRTQMVNFEISDENSDANLEKLLNDLMKGTSTEDTCFLENKIPSPFIVGCIQYSQNHKDVKKNLKQFLSVYIANLLHCNYTPELNEILIGDTKLDVRNYVAGWISEPVAVDDSVASKDTTLKKISEVVIDGKDVDMLEIFSFLEEGTPEESDVTIFETPYKISASTIDTSELIIWAKYLIFCAVRLTNLGKLQEIQQRKIVGLFEFILEVTKKQHRIDIARTIIMSLFKNQHLWKIYHPIDQIKDDSSVLTTDFLLKIINKETDIIEYLNNNNKILKAFQQKNYNEINKFLIKIKKRKNVNSEHTVRVLKMIGMSAEHDSQILKQIFEIEADYCVGEDREPTLILEIVRVVVEKYSKYPKTDLPHDVLHKIFTLYTNLLVQKKITPNLTNLETALIEYLDRKPNHVKHITEENFKQFFYANTIRKTTAQLAATILKLNAKLCSVFKEQIGRQEILGQRELTLPLGNAMLKHVKFLVNNKELLSVIYNEYKSNIFKILEKPHKAGQIYITCWKFIQKLLLECVNLDDCVKMFNKIHKYESVELSHAHLLKSMFLKMCLHAKGQKKEYLTNYLSSMLSIITMALKESKGTDSLSGIVEDVYQVAAVSDNIEGFQTSETEDFKKFTESSSWQNFCKAVLKDSLKVNTENDVSNNCGPKLLSLLTALVKLLYSKEHGDIVTLFEMVTSHSEFLKVMLSHNSPEIKTRLIELLHALILNNKSVMRAAQIPVYLSAYHATRSPCDRLILSIIHFYESNEIPVHEYKPYLWGDSAANHYAVRKNKTTSLWAHPSPNHVINLFDKEMLERTIIHYPVTHKLDYNYELPATNLTPNSHSASTIVDNLSKDGLLESSHIKDFEYEVNRLTLKAKYDRLRLMEEVDFAPLSQREEYEGTYDPAFVFPLLSHLLAPGSVASCYKVLRTGLLSLPVMALSSLCPMMRAAAYHVLHRFCMLLETETKHKNDKLLLTDFVEMLRQSLSSAVAQAENEGIPGFKNPRLPAVDALYLARALLVSTNPNDPLYKPVNNFLIAKQQVDLTIVPDFLSLFHDSEVESADRRNWILETIRDGTKTMTDVNVVFKTMCLKMIMDYYSSVLSDRKCQEKILGVIGSLVAIPRAFEIMVEGYGLMSWLHCVIRQLGKNDKVLLKRLLDIIRNMLYSMSVNAVSNALKTAKRNGKSVIDLPELIIGKDLEHDILILLNDMARLTEELDVAGLVSFVKTYNLLTKKTLKLLNKKLMFGLVNQSSVVTNNLEIFGLLSRALIMNNSEVLVNSHKPDTSNDDDHNQLEVELTILVRKYL